MADSLKRMFQNLANNEILLIQGAVISLSPFRIQAVNDSKLILGSLSLVIPSRLGSFEIGEKVHMLVLNSGKKFYVIDRV